MKYSISFGLSVFPMSASSGNLYLVNLSNGFVRLHCEEMKNGLKQIAVNLGDARARPLDEFPKDVKNYIDDVEQFLAAVKHFSEQYGSNRHVVAILYELDTHITLVRYDRELPSNMQNPVHRIHRQWHPRDFTPSVIAYIHKVDLLMDDTERVFGQLGANDYVGEEIMHHLQRLQDETMRGKVVPYQGQPHRGQSQGRRPDQGHPPRGQRQPPRGQASRADENLNWRS